MARDQHLDSSPLAEDFDVGDDSDLPSFDQPYSLDDIEAIRNGPGASLDERRDQLRRMLDDLRSRQGMDETGEFSGLITELRLALASMGGSGEDIGSPEGFGFDPDDRVLAPDEILERAEAEEALERDDADSLR